jgi:cytochrome c2
MSALGAYLEPAQIAKGQQVYAEKKCSGCHAIQGEGGTVGPDLSRVGLKREPEWLFKFLKNPKVVRSSAKMTPFEGDDQELEALVAYLATLQ